MNRIYSVPADSRIQSLTAWCCVGGQQPADVFVHVCLWQTAGICQPSDEWSHTKPCGWATRRSSPTVWVSPAFGQIWMLNWGFFPTTRLGLLLYGSSFKALKLQHIQNSAAHPLLWSHYLMLCWLPVTQHIHFIVLLLTHKVLHNRQPPLLWCQPPVSSTTQDPAPHLVTEPSPLLLPHSGIVSPNTPVTIQTYPHSNHISKHTFLGLRLMSDQYPVMLILCF